MFSYAVLFVLVAAIGVTAAIDTLGARVDDIYDDEYWGI